MGVQFNVIFNKSYRCIIIDNMDVVNIYVHVITKYSPIERFIAIYSMRKHIVLELRFSTVSPQ